MLDSALSFERLVKNPKTGSKESGGKTQVTWDNPPELEAYIDKLQAAADQLTSENRRLRKCHYNISDKVFYWDVLILIVFFGPASRDIFVVQFDGGSMFKPWQGHCVVFLGKTLYSHSASLHPGV